MAAPGFVMLRLPQTLSGRQSKIVYRIRLQHEHERIEAELASAAKAAKKTKAANHSVTSGSSSSSSGFAGSQPTSASRMLAQSAAAHTPHSPIATAAGTTGVEPFSVVIHNNSDASDVLQQLAPAPTPPSTLAASGKSQTDETIATAAVAAAGPVMSPTGHLDLVRDVLAAFGVAERDLVWLSTSPRVTAAQQPATACATPPPSVVGTTTSADAAGAAGAAVIPQPAAKSPADKPMQISLTTPQTPAASSATATVTSMSSVATNTVNATTKATRGDHPTASQKSSSASDHVVLFPCLHDVEQVLNALLEAGVGIVYGSVDILPLLINRAAKPLPRNRKRKPQSSNAGKSPRHKRLDSLRPQASATVRQTSAPAVVSTAAMLEPVDKVLRSNSAGPTGSYNIDHKDLAVPSGERPASQLITTQTRLLRVDHVAEEQLQSEEAAVRSSRQLDAVDSANTVLSTRTTNPTSTADAASSTHGSISKTNQKLAGSEQEDASNVDDSDEEFVSDDSTEDDADDDDDDEDDESNDEAGPKRKIKSTHFGGDDLDEGDDDSEDAQDQEDIVKLRTGFAKFQDTVRSRLMVDQVASVLQSAGELSFDFLALTVVASCLAGLGLGSNNAVVIVASMLVSPIMGPILAVTFGSVIRDRHLITTGVRSEVIGLSICLAMGFIMGTIWTNWGPQFSWPTSEMAARGDWTGMYIGICVAIASGFGVALSVLGNNTSSLVGVAISASLLPPAVNAGMLFAYSIWGPLILTATERSAIDFNDVARTGGISFLLTVVNIICVFFSAYAMFKLKQVAPIAKKPKFWRDALPNYRENGETLAGSEANELGERFQRFVQRHGGAVAPSELDGNPQAVAQAMEENERTIFAAIQHGGRIPRGSLVPRDNGGGANAFGEDSNANTVMPPWRVRPIPVSDILSYARPFTSSSSWDHTDANSISLDPGQATYHNPTSQLSPGAARLAKLFQPPPPLPVFPNAYYAGRPTRVAQHAYGRPSVLIHRASVPHQSTENPTSIKTTTC
ncbi:hypothetical protein CAOG_01132 [Capsaspora owczarzaki ATCC 30864]|uniref:DUF389 domain-containing protein n=1 Tax=Capsaspora owczarzaki (strain ATCC 30864) TaxID=595528 RepID=A0A0D2WJT9_CAPO3|nr:hypothetical protein CAOG_01132 [Capsaspora owczarzaki ATCC 30864]KJE89698.1 hypothetical protein CAOG_001132 [Capsaspora owczarzaki ATCC 30864]|eukprot:XP_004366003.1 hypothetical protein CAOG_01132 [Capsaspora owczarzaki ATCC 30864]